MNKKFNVFFLLVFLIFSSSTEGTREHEHNSEEEGLENSQALASPLTDFRLHRFTQGNIIYLFGSSTSGKSTLLREISERRPDFTFVSTRGMKELFSVKILRKLFPDEMNLLLRSYHTQNILPLIFEDESSNKSALEDYSKINHRAYEALKVVRSRLDELYNIYPTRSSYMCGFYEFFFSHIFSLSNKGKTVVVDNVFVGKFHTYKMKYFYHAPVFYILNYLSPLLFNQRVSLRNENARLSDPRNMRSLMRPVETFLSIYGKGRGGFVASIPRGLLHETLYSLYKDSKKQSLPNRLLDNDFSSLCETFDREFGKSECLSISSKYPFDLLLNSGASSSSSNATRFLSLKNW